MKLISYSGKGETKRPDRVMIYADEVVILDYKFEERSVVVTQTQMRNYIRLIRQMGNKTFPHTYGMSHYPALKR